MVAKPGGKRRPVGVPGIEPLVVEIVAAYVARNRVSPGDLPGLIEAIHATMSAMMLTANLPPAPVPAVPIRRSAEPNYMVCLEDGRKMQSLRRYLRTKYNMTPEAYRAKWGLPSDYPMTCANYSARRSQLARDMGFGRKKVAAEKPPQKRSR